jgi:hypothetical protein
MFALLPRPRLRPTLEVGDRNVEPIILEVTATLGQSQRKIIEMRLVAHAEPERRFFELLRATHPCESGEEGRAGQAGRKGSAVQIHDVRAARSFSPA